MHLLRSTGIACHLSRTQFDQEKLTELDAKIRELIDE
jgi:hypothetical protein